MSPSRLNLTPAQSSYTYVPPVHQKGQDVYIDMQYAQHNFHDQLKFAKEPWKYCENDINCYLGLRFEHREKFKQKLKEMDEEFKIKLREMEGRIKEREEDEEFQKKLKEMQDSNGGKRLKRVEHEEKRIRQARINLFTKKEKMIEQLKSRKMKWKEEVKEKREAYVKGVEQRRLWYPQNWIRDRQLDLALLERVKSWNIETEAEPEDETLKPEPEKEYGFKACAIYFKKTEDGWGPDTHAHKGFKDGKFPNQKISVHDLLQPSSDNPLSEKCEENQLRYFHFPSNNMRWIEEAMARYYSEKTGTHSDTRARGQKSSRAEKLLSREYWRGQLHGGDGVGGNGPTGPVHARHMRSRCSLISLVDRSSAALTQKQPLRNNAKNFAIFLPYLHWETNSRRAKMAQVIKEVTKEAAQKVGAENHRKVGKAPLNGAPPEADNSSKKGRGCFLSKKGPEEKEKQNEETEIDDDPDEEITPKKKGMLEFIDSKNMKNGKGFKTQRKSKLGKYLLSLAEVANAIDCDADEQLLRENLHQSPHPLHIRRTLDQSYFLTLEDTTSRDEDQVVYRETREGRSFHTRNTRVVMVDQLWLWVLDGNTIITSFPRRWGRNKPDPSGVHKSLRERLESTPPEEIQSVYDLALIIIDQCSRVFFDRTKPLDQRPEVMDLFASAIGNVTEHTTIAYESFWRNMAFQGMKCDRGSGMVTKKRSYLDINPEGILLREAQDVAEELQIMLRIYNQQLHVVRDFRKILGHMNGESKNEADEVRTLVKALQHNQKGAGDKGQTNTPGDQPIVPESTIQEANDLLELIRNRRTEIEDLEAAALRTTQQLQGLLSLKQQQASIIEAKAALVRADESVKQGRAIMAFTLVTIFFLPLGFLAAFFGMNNEQINQASWMSLGEQMKYMFGISTGVIVISVSIAFSPWTRATLTTLVKLPIVFVLEYTGIRALWKKHIVGHRYFEDKNQQRIDWIYGHGERKGQRKAEEKEKREKEMIEHAFEQGSIAKFIDIFHFGERKQSLSKRGSVPGGSNTGNWKVEGDGSDVEKGLRNTSGNQG